MAVLMTRAEYETKYGTPPSIPATSSTASTPVQPSQTSNIPGYDGYNSENQKPVETQFGNQINARADKTAQILNDQTPAGKTNVVEKGLGIVGQGAGAATDLVGDAIGIGTKAANSVLGGVPGNIVQSIAKTPLGVMGIQALKGGADSWDKYTQAHPRAAQDLSAVGSIANLIATFYTGGAAKAGAEVVGNVTKDAIKTGVDNTVGKVTSAVQKSGEEKNLAEAVKRVTPDYATASPTNKIKLQAQTVTQNETKGVPLKNPITKPRINEGGIIKERTVNPSSLEKEAAKELITVPGYTSKLTHLQTENIVRPEIAARGRGLESSLGAERVIIPKKQVVSIVRNAIESVPESSLLLQKADPAIGNYLRVATNSAAKNDGTLKGVLKVRKELDEAYENARGRLAYDSDKLSALDEVHQAGRDALTQYLIDHAVNTDVKAALRSQWNLYRALDVISAKAVKEPGSKLGRINKFVKEHPLATAAGAAAGTYGVVKATGL